MKKILLLIVLSSIFLVSCKKEEEVYIKPNVETNINFDNLLTKDIVNDLSIMQKDTMLTYKYNVTHSLDLDLDGTREEVLLKDNGKFLVDDVEYIIEDCSSDEFTIGKIDNTIFLLFGCDDGYAKIYKYDDELILINDDIKGVPVKDIFIENNLLYSGDKIYKFENSYFEEM